jgi:hypothetical protein
LYVLININRKKRREIKRRRLVRERERREKKGKIR